MSSPNKITKEKKNPRLYSFVLMINDRLCELRKRQMSPRHFGKIPSNNRPKFETLSATYISSRFLFIFF